MACGGDGKEQNQEASLSHETAQAQLGVALGLHRADRPLAPGCCGVLFLTKTEKSRSLSWGSSRPEIPGVEAFETTRGVCGPERPGLCLKTQRKPKGKRWLLRKSSGTSVGRTHFPAEAGLGC